MNDRHQIQVDVETAYLEEQSEPSEHRFVFATPSPCAMPAKCLQNC